jgi:hypothetical protein
MGPKTASVILTFSTPLQRDVATCTHLQQRKMHIILHIHFKMLVCVFAYRSNFILLYLTAKPCFGNWTQRSATVSKVGTVSHVAILIQCLKLTADSFLRLFQQCTTLPDRRHAVNNEFDETSLNEHTD